LERLTSWHSEVGQTGPGQSGPFTTTGDCATSDHGYSKLITFAFLDGVQGLNTITNYFRAHSTP
jgi:hypothetical protein